MRTNRRQITSSLRSALMIAAGTALFALPVVLQLGGAAIMLGIAAGVIATSLGIAGTDASGRGTLPLSAHAAYDRGLAFGLLLAGVIFGLADQPEALALFGGAGLAQLFVGTVTRYTARPVVKELPHTDPHIASLLPRKRPANAGRFPLMHV